MDLYLCLLPTVFAVIPVLYTLSLQSPLELQSLLESLLESLHDSLFDSLLETAALESTALESAALREE